MWSHPQRGLSVTTHSAIGASLAGGSGNPNLTQTIALVSISNFRCLQSQAHQQPPLEWSLPSYLFPFSLLASARPRLQTLRPLAECLEIPTFADCSIGLCLVCCLGASACCVRGSPIRGSICDSRRISRSDSFEEPWVIIPSNCKLSHRASCMRSPPNQ